MVPINEISDMVWFLVEVSKNTNTDDIKSSYCILHMADLIDMETSEVCINGSVKFMLHHILTDGMILNASNSIIDLVLETELLLQNTIEIHKFVQQLLQRFPHTLRGIFCMSQTLMEKCKNLENANQINNLLLQVRQLSQDTMEIHEVAQCLLNRLVYSTNISYPVHRELERQAYRDDGSDSVER